ncbi:MAG: hypothetical protein K2H53_06095 [Clostridia bacterium]|nr:hypothetical protein [Clostridia bacterium]
MENASKALIIAGAILISIILVSIGIIVVQSANGVIGGAQESFSEQEIRIFNSEFENYIGDQKGSTVRTLMNKVKSSNATHDEDHQVTVTGPNGETLPDDISAAVRPTTTYQVSIQSNAKSGLITSITVNSKSEKKSE